MSQIAIFQQFYNNKFVSVLKCPRGVGLPFGSDTTLMSESGYECLICRLVDHYGQFQNVTKTVLDSNLTF